MLLLENANCRLPQWDLPTYKRYLPGLARYLTPLLSEIGRAERRVAIARYIEGLLLPGRRKFIRPLAERLNIDSQSLQQAIAQSPWDEQQVWSAIRAQVVPLLEPIELWAINERAWIKQGNATVAVDNQRCGANGKKSHCQVSLEVLLTDGVLSAPAAARLYLPENWAADEDLRQRAEIPDEVDFSTKPALAIQLMKELLRDGVQAGIVTGDSSYGNDAEFRLSLQRLGLEFFLEVDPCVLYAWDSDAAMLGSVTKLQMQPCRLDSMIAEISPAEWNTCSWTAPDGITRHTRLAMRDIFLDSGAYEIPQDVQKLCLVVDWPKDNAKPYRCCLGYFVRPPSQVKCLRLSRYRGYHEFYRECFDRMLDLACYQGRSWKGFHHHLVLAAAAYLFILTAELRKRRPFWPCIREDAPVDHQIAEETARFASILLRSGNSAGAHETENGNALRPSSVA